MSIIGIYGGSFNPPHLGHKKLVQSFLAYSKIDTCWIFPTPTPPHKAKELAAPFQHRLKMCELLWSDTPNCKVSTIESEIEGPNYTFKTLQLLKKNYPSNQWVLCIGSDSAKTLQSWYESVQLIDLVEEVIIALRTGEKVDEYELSFLTGKQNIISSHEPVHYSSTELRSLMKRTKNNDKVLLEAGLDEHVLRYIKDKNLYSMR